MSQAVQGEMSERILAILQATREQFHELAGQRSDLDDNRMACMVAYDTFYDSDVHSIKPLLTDIRVVLRSSTSPYITSLCGSTENRVRIHQCDRAI